MHLALASRASPLAIRALLLILLVGWRGVEPPVSGLKARRVTWLRYQPLVGVEGIEPSTIGI